MAVFCASAPSTAKFVKNTNKPNQKKNFPIRAIAFQTQLTGLAWEITTLLVLRRKSLITKAAITA